MTSRLSRKKRYAYLSLAAVVLAIGAYLYRAIVSGDYYTCQTLLLPNQKKLIISGASFWEISQDLYYQIQDKQSVTERQLFGFAADGADNLKLGTVTVDRGSIVGVVDDYRPNVLLILLDLKEARSREEMAGIIRHETNQNYILPEEIDLEDGRHPRIM